MVQNAAELDDEIDDCPVIRVMVSAIGCQRPSTAAPCSVFELAEKSFKQRRAAAKNEEPVSSCYAARVAVGEGVTRITGAVYPMRWTQDQQEKEIERRARQRPPRPTKGAKTRSRKLLDLVGDDEEG